MRCGAVPSVEVIYDILIVLRRSVENIRATHAKNARIRASDQLCKHGLSQDNLAVV